MAEETKGAARATPEGHGVSDGRGPVLEVGPILRSMGRSKVRFGLIVLEIALSGKALS